MFGCCWVSMRPSRHFLLGLLLGLLLGPAGLILSLEGYWFAQSIDGRIAVTCLEPTTEPNAAAALDGCEFHSGGGEAGSGDGPAACSRGCSHGKDWFPQSRSCVIWLCDYHAGNQTSRDVWTYPLPSRGVRLRFCSTRADQEFWSVRSSFPESQKSTRRKIERRQTLFQWNA